MLYDMFFVGCIFLIENLYGNFISKYLIVFFMLLEYKKNIFVLKIIW